MSHAGGDKDKRKQGAGVAPSEAVTSDTVSRKLIFELVTRALRNARIKLDPRQVGEIVTIVMARMKNIVRRKGAKEGSGVEDMGEGEILKTVTEAMSGSDPEFKARLAKIIAEGPQRKLFVEKLEEESAAPGIMQKIMRSLFRTKAPDTKVQAEEEEEMVISAPIIRDTEKEAIEKTKIDLNEELKRKQQLKAQPARRPESLAMKYGVPLESIKAPSPRAAAPSKVPPPLPASRPLPTTPPPSGAQTARKPPPPPKRSTQNEPVVHSPVYGGVNLKKVRSPVKQEVNKEQTDLQKAFAARGEKPDDDGNPPPKRPGSGSF
jgi:hypothetical protein